MKIVMSVLFSMSWIFGLVAMSEDIESQEIETSYRSPEQLARIAAAQDHLEDMNKYLMGALDIRDSDGRTLLHYAARFGALNVARYLLNKRHSLISIADKAGKLPLHEAFEYKQTEVFKLLFAAHIHGENGLVLHNYAKRGLFANEGMIITSGAPQNIGRVVRNSLNEINVLPVLPITQ